MSMSSGISLGIMAHEIVRLERKIKVLEEALKDESRAHAATKKRIDEAVRLADGRWEEWGGRAMTVYTALTGDDE